MSGGYARIVRSVKPEGRRAYVPESGNDSGTMASAVPGRYRMSLYARRLERIHVVAYRLTDDRGVANGKRARIITERLRLGGSAVRRVVRHCEKANCEKARREKSATRGRRHRLLGVLSVIFAALALACSVLRMLPEDLEALPYIPVIVSATP